MPEGCSMLCMECGAELRWTEDEFEGEYRGERFAVHGVAHWACDACGNYQVDGAGCNAVPRSLATQYARRHGVPTSARVEEPNEESLESIREADEMFSSGNRGYATVDELVAALEAQDGVTP